MAHTKGPWEMKVVSTSCGFCLKIGPFPHTQTETNHACIYVDDRAYLHAEELKANAQLISAAPDLLEALENAKSMYPTHTDCTVWKVIIEETNAAIKKARGQS